MWTKAARACGDRKRSGILARCGHRPGAQQGGGSSKRSSRSRPCSPKALRVGDLPADRDRPQTAPVPQAHGRGRQRRDRGGPSGLKGTDRAAGCGRAPLTLRLVAANFGCGARAAIRRSASFSAAPISSRMARMSSIWRSSIALRAPNSSMSATSVPARRVRCRRGRRVRASPAAKPSRLPRRIRLRRTRSRRL